MSILQKSFHFWSPFDAIGRQVLARLFLLYLIFELIGKALFYGIGNVKHHWRAIIHEVYAIGIRRSAAVVLIMSLLAGFLVVSIGSNSIGLWGDRQLLGAVLVQIIALESAPLLIAVIMISRSATAICAEIGTARLQQQLPAIHQLEKSDYGHVLFPKLAGAWLSYFCLNCYFIFFAYIGGYLMSLIAHDMPPIVYLRMLTNAGQLPLLLAIGIKGLFNPLIIIALACYSGLRVNEHFGLSHANAFTVRYCVAYVILFNVIISLGYYIILFGNL